MIIDLRERSEEEAALIFYATAQDLWPGDVFLYKDEEVYFGGDGCWHIYDGEGECTTIPISYL